MAVNLVQPLFGALSRVSRSRAELIDAWMQFNQELSDRCEIELRSTPRRRNVIQTRISQSSPESVNLRAGTADSLLEAARRWWPLAGGSWSIHKA